LERAEYERLAALDRRLWWFRGLHAQILGALAQTQPPRDSGVVLDAGCGTGGLLAALGERFPATELIGLDLDPGAGIVARRVSGRPACVGSVNALPFAGTTFAAIVSADVLCHRAVDEVAALEQFRRCLVPGGVLVLNLPAYRWLLSQHDAAVHSVRRYTATGVRRLLAGTGFTRIRTSYWNTALFPLMVLRRRLRWSTSTAPASDVALLPMPVEALFGLIVRVEAAILALGLRLPFGGSVLAVAVKP
jgi:SAM-dependent methyltransferase